MAVQSVDVSHIYKIFGFSHALKDVTFSITEGETIGFLGPNGAGKSTLLKIISLLMRPTKGHVSLFGKDVAEDQDLLKRDIGVLLSTPFFYEDLSGRENLEFYMRMNKRGMNRDSVVDKLVSDHKLRLYIDRPTHELSTGMAKKLEILRVIIPVYPRLLLLDEPFAGLDFENRKIMINLITDRPSDRTVIICSHDFRTVAKLCDRVIYLEKGNISKILEKSEFDFFLEKSA
ncbi:MAG: ABC transporter ATP-binding protein [Candidatus Thorarchaeota archaeon]